jgi:putative Mn2+ efflux pump MntP
MTGLSLFAVAVALGVDAFAVATAVGLCHNPLRAYAVARLAGAFGLFQALMPVVGWAAGNAVHQYIAAADHWIAFGLLAMVGGKMIVGALRGGDERPLRNDPSEGWNLLVLSIATSIDALAVGLSIAAIGGPILVPAIVIGIVAAIMTAMGMAIGCRIGASLSKGIEIIGGLVLLAIGARILFEHLS